MPDARDWSTAVYRPAAGLGLGLEAQAWRAMLFAEARYQAVLHNAGVVGSRSLRLVPLCVGIRLRGA